ncbi:hypothetical protein ACLOJK_039249 [Asimina triloba]
MPGGGFALSDYKSFDSAIPHQFIHILASMARQTYNYIGYSPMAITLAAEGNWLTLADAVSSAPSPAQKVLISTPWFVYKNISVVTVSSAARPSHNAVIIATASSASKPTYKAATPTPRSAHKTASAVAAASSAPRPFHKATTSISRSARKTTSASSAALSASGRIKRR